MLIVTILVMINICQVNVCHKHFMPLIHLIIRTAELDIILIVQMRELRLGLNVASGHTSRLELTKTHYFLHFKGRLISLQTKRK